MFGDFQPDPFDYLSVHDYQQELPITLSDIYKHVIETLEISKCKMQQHYNKHLRFHDYEEGQKVWLKAKHYKTGESRKLAPRRNGPWAVQKKLPNGVNFRIQHLNKELKVVHHDHLLPFRHNEHSREQIIRQNNFSSECLSELSDSDESIESLSNNELENENRNSSGSEEDESVNRDYPRRERQPRQVPGTLPWEVLNI